MFVNGTIHFSHRDSASWKRQKKTKREKEGGKEDNERQEESKSVKVRQKLDLFLLPAISL